MVEYDGIFVKLTKMQLIFENSDIFVKLTEFQYSLTKKIPCFVVNPLSILFNYRYLWNNLKILGSNGFVTSKPQGMNWLPRDVWKLLHPVQKTCNDITYFYFLTVSKIVTGSIGWCCYFARIPACSTTKSSCSDDTFSYSIGKPNAIYTFTARKPQDNWQHPLHDWWRWHCGIWSRRAKIETQTKG